MYKLTELEELNLSDNKKLKKLDDKILQLSNLTTLNCLGCDSLVHPPSAVCEQGISAVRKYFTDLQAEIGVELTIVPVAIIGQKYSGKTSIARSVQQGKRILTNSCKLVSGDTS